MDAFGRSFEVYIYTFLLIYGKDRLLVLWIIGEEQQQQQQSRGPEGFSGQCLSLRFEAWGNLCQAPPGPFGQKRDAHSNGGRGHCREDHHPAHTEVG